PEKWADTPDTAPGRRAGWGAGPCAPRALRSHVVLSKQRVWSCSCMVTAPRHLCARPLLGVPRALDVLWRLWLDPFSLGSPGTSGRATVGAGEGERELGNCLALMAQHNPANIALMQEPLRVRK